MLVYVYVKFRPDSNSPILVRNGVVVGFRVRLPTQVPRGQRASPRPAEGPPKSFLEGDNPRKMAEPGQATLAS